MFSGCYTALITPMNSQGLDVESLRKLVEFQVSCDVSGILAVGTTGESPTLDWTEHDMVIEKVHEFADGKCVTIGGTGSNSTVETMRGTKHAVKSGVEAVLLVDPYYNGPSSLEIRREYVEVIAKAFPDTSVIPYVIPGRTGTKLLPEDLATAYKNYPNVCAVKEATEDFDNMRRTRECCGEDFVILSGDDGKTLDMMVDPAIKAAGVISVASNIAPAAVQKMTEHLAKGEIEEGKKLAKALEPLFGIVTVKTEEETPYGTVICKARNPLGTKTLMNIMGMPSGPCRQPLGKMTEKGIQVVVDAAKKVYENNPEILKPVEDFFGVNLEERLNDKKFCQGLYYED